MSEFHQTTETQEAKASPYAIQQLVIYPIKSMQGISVESAIVTPRGFLGDRTCMLVDQDGKPITQREQPRMAQIHVEIPKAGHMEVSAPGMQPFDIAIDSNGEQIETQVWNDRVVVRKQHIDAALWFSTFLETPCFLVMQDPLITRLVSQKYAHTNDDSVSLADGYPFHIVTLKSLEQLNTAGQMQIPADRWRANIILPGKFPYGEDFWGEVEIAGVRFILVKACHRCVITTTDQTTGGQDTEPLVTLAHTRRFENGTKFGQYAIPVIPDEGEPIIRVGDRIKIIKQK